MRSSFKPFPILGFKTGLYNYTSSYTRPDEAFDPLENAFVYRSTLQQRQGYTAFGAGVLRYQNTEIVATGDGTSGPFSGTISNFPIITGTTAVITAMTSGGKETWTFTATASNVAGSIAPGNDKGALNYTTGAWSIDLTASGRTISNTTKITIAYIYISPGNPIMGIKQWTNETDNTKKLIVLDTKRAAVYNPSTGNFDPLISVSSTPLTVIPANGTGAPVVTTVTVSTGFQNLAPYSITLSDGTPAHNVTDLGNGNFSTNAFFTATSTVNYTTGSITVVYTTPAMSPAVTISYLATLAGDYFTGTPANFFNAVMWKPTETSSALLWLTNNKDRVTTFDGTSLARPLLGITLAHVNAVNDIATTLDVKVYKNRLLLLRPTIVGNAFPDAQSIRWSAIFNPVDFAADVPGHGGELSAPTGDWLQAAQPLRDQLIVFFEFSTWSFRFTGNDFNPFVWTQLNSSKRTNSPYASVAYDERCTSIGPSGIIACDGVNVQRFDINIIDEFENVDQDFAIQCFSQRYDPQNQTWMLYPAVEGAGQATGTSNSVLVYNFLENTWSTAVFLDSTGNNLRPMCLGLFLQTADATWADFAPGGKYQQYAQWQQADIPWNNFLFQSQAPIMLLGDFTGHIWETFSNTTDNGRAIEVDVTTKRWNPFLNIGERVQLGYVDFYYTVQAGDTLTISFMVDNAENPTVQRTLTLDGGTTNPGFAWKRIYCNIIGEFIQINIDPATAKTFQILGMVLWARPSGRFTP